MIAAQQNQIATPFGELLLDPPTLLVLEAPTISGTKLAVLDLQIPQDRR
jgi:hypothetical protein